MLLALVVLPLIPIVIYEYLPVLNKVKLYSYWYSRRWGYGPDLAQLQRSFQELDIRDEHDPERHQAEVIFCNGYLYTPRSPHPVWLGFMVLILFVSYGIAGILGWLESFSFRLVFDD